MNILTQLVTAIVKTCDQNNFVTDIITEVGRVNMNSESSGTRAIAKFLEEMAENCASEIMPNISNLLQYLEQDAYMMRSAVILIIGKLVSKILSDDSNLDSEAKELRDQLLDVLEEHILDATTFTRSKDIQVWTRLCEEGKIPLSRLETLIEAIVGRLKDKSVYVRKSAVIFLTAFLKKNPFAAKIPITTLKAALNKESGKLKAMMEASQNGAVSDSDCAVPDPDGTNPDHDSTLLDQDQDATIIADLDLDDRNVAKDIENAAANLINGGDEQEAKTIQVPNLTSINRQQILIKYLGDSVKFAEQIHISIPLVCSLLYSPSVTDAQAAIDFFVCAYHFGVQGAIIGIRKMIVLIFSRDKVVREAVITAYKKVYLESAELEERSHRARDIAVVKSLIELVLGASLGEMISLEELLKHLFEANEITKDHTRILFEKFAKKIQDTTDEESRASVQLLSMLACSNKNLIRENIDVLISVGLEERGRSDLRLAQYTCLALQKSVEEKIIVEQAEPCYRFEKDHILAVRLKEMLVGSITNIEDQYWIPMSDEAVKVIYKLLEHPDAVCEDILKEMIKQILPLIKSATGQTDETPMEEETVEGGGAASQETAATQNSAATQPFVFEGDLNSDILTRLITIVGHIALNQLIHMESNITTEIKIRRFLKEEKDESRREKKSRSVAKTPRNKGRPSMPKTPGEEEELGLAGAAAVEDVEAEAIAHLCNEEMVESR